MKILQVLGTGCPKCKKMAENAQAAIKEAGIEGEVVKVTDINDMIERGVMSTPALIIDGKLMAQGKIPKMEQLKEWIEKGV